MGSGEGQGRRRRTGRRRRISARENRSGEAGNMISSSVTPRPPRRVPKSALTGRSPWSRSVAVEPEGPSTARLKPPSTAVKSSTRVPWSVWPGSSATRGGSTSSPPAHRSSTTRGEPASATLTTGAAETDPPSRRAARLRAPGGGIGRSSRSRAGPCGTKRSLCPCACRSNSTSTREAPTARPSTFSRSQSGGNCGASRARPAGASGSKPSRP